MPLFNRDPKAKFAKKAEQVVRSLGYADSLAYDEELFAFRLAGDRTIMLGNIYGHHQTLSGDSADHYLTGALAGLLQDAQTPKTFEEARPRLFPSVRDRTFLESARLLAAAGSGPAPDMPLRELGSNLVSLLVIDAPTSIMTVNADHLSDWGVGFDEAMVAARDNLLAQSQDAVWGRVIDGVYASMWNDDYDVSRLLLDEVIDEVDRDLGLNGDPVAFVPHRNLLILTGADDDAGLQAAMELTEEKLDQPSQVSARPLVRRDGVWRDLELDSDRPAAAGLRRLLQADLALAHGALTPLIQQLVGEDVFVANAILAEKDGEVISSAAWSDGVPSLLPKTDRILFFRSQEETWMVDWKEAERVVGDLLEPTDYYPPRVRVERFPTDEQLGAMEQVENWRDG